MLKGEKVILRSMERDDLRRLHELEQNVDLVVLADGSWHPSPLAELEKRFERFADRHDASWFAIEADSEVIGEMVLHGQQRRDGVAELGIGIYHPNYVGKGYGRDAINVLLKWAFQIQNWRRIWLNTVGQNERAIRAYRACGFVEEGRLRQHTFCNGIYDDEVQMGLLRTEWEARQQGK
jgi:diamine N-acetyltransferase